MKHFQILNKGFLTQSIDNNFNLANINKIGEIKRQSVNQLATNEGNFGYTVIYKVREWSNKFSNNKNYLKRKYGSPDGR